MIRMQVVVAVLIAGLTVPTAAQRGAANNGAEIQRLQDSAYLVERDLSSLSQRDLMDELDELQRYSGVDRDFAFCLDPAATTDLHRYSMQALFGQGSQNTAQPLWDESGNQIWQTTLTLNEVL